MIVESVSPGYLYTSTHGSMRWTGFNFKFDFDWLDCCKGFIKNVGLLHATVYAVLI